MADVNYIPITAPEIGWKPEGALAGFDFAERDLDHQRMVQNQMSLADLAALRKVKETEEWMKQAPTRDIEDMVKRGGFESDRAMQESGLWNEAARAEKQGKILKTQEGAFDFTQKQEAVSKAKRMENLWTFAELMSEYTPESMTRAAGMFKRMTGSDLPPEYMQLHPEDWKQMSTAIRNSVEHTRALEKVLEKEAMEYRRAVDVAEINAKSHDKSSAAQERRLDLMEQENKRKFLRDSAEYGLKRAKQMEEQAWMSRQMIEKKDSKKRTPDEVEFLNSFNQKMSELRAYQEQKQKQYMTAGGSEVDEPPSMTGRLQLPAGATLK
jgi:hypothetical protein